MSEDWVVDSLAGFLQSPVWSSPVNDYIEQNCVVFDPGEENKFAYSEIHNDYHALVEELLDSFTAELGITAEQLAQACLQSSTLKGAHEKQLEQVLAAENFAIFKSIMVQKNIDLELQALSLLQKQLGHAPEAYDPESEPTARTISGGNKEDEDSLFKEALEQSRKEFEKQESLDEEEIEKLIALATQESLRLFEASKREKQSQNKASIQPPSDKSEGTSIDVQTDESTGPPSPKGSSPSTKDPELECKKPSLPKITSPQRKQQAPLQSLFPKHISPSSEASSAPRGSVSSSEAASLWLQSAKAEFGESSGGSTTGKQKVGVKVPADLKNREAYLKRQRDHLLDIKRKARAKELDTYNTNKTAPKAAKVSSAAPTENLTDKAGSKSVPENATAAALVENGSGRGGGKKGFNTGVLCSVIADKLKEQSN